MERQTQSAEHAAPAGARPAPPRPARPREKGAWGILLVPFSMGVLATWPPRDPLALAAALCLVLGLFLVQAAVLPWLVGERAHGPRLAATWRSGLLAVASAAFLACRPGMRALGPIGAAAAALLSLHVLARREKGRRDAWTQISGAAGLSLSAALAAATQQPQELPRAWAVAAVAALYFAAAISLVRACIAARGAGSPLAQARGARTALLAQAAALLAFVAGAACGLLPWTVPIAFLPALARVLWYLRLPRFDLPPRQLGWREVFVSALFAAGCLGFSRLP